MEWDRAFIFHIYIHIYIPLGKTLFLVPKSRSSVKVKYQGHSFRNNGRCGGISVSQTQFVHLPKMHCHCKMKKQFSYNPD